MLLLWLNMTLLKSQDMKEEQGLTLDIGEPQSIVGHHSGVSSQVEIAV
jgi:hypothetical protein